MESQKWGDPEAAMAQVEDQIRHAQETAQRAQALEAELQQLTGRAVSKDRSVSVAVSSSGLLTELNLSANARELGERDLAAVIKATVNAAHRDVGRQAVSLTEETFGADSPVTERLRNEAAAREVPPQESGIRY